MRTITTILTLTVWLASAAWAADAKAGQAVYDKACKNCHGADGTANPALAKALKADVKDLKSADVQSMSDDQLKKIIVEGVGKMRPVKTVSGSDADNVVAYVRSLKK